MITLNKQLFDKDSITITDQFGEVVGVIRKEKNYYCVRTKKGFSVEVDSLQAAKNFLDKICDNRKKARTVKAPVNTRNLFTGKVDNLDLSHTQKKLF